MSTTPLLDVKDLTKIFTTKKGFPVARTVSLRAVDGVSFSVGRGEALGIVGESGCGKSTVARVALRLLKANRTGPQASRLPAAEGTLTV